MTSRCLAVFVLACASLVGCSPKVGGKCSGAGAICTDKNDALFCAEGTFIAVTCRGDKGCSQNGTVVDCDESIASEQDGCNAPDAVACTRDRKEALRCTNHRFVIDETCKGPKGCAMDGAQKITCDNDIADVGDPCHFNGDYACTSDRSLVMKCVGNKMVPLNTCRGPKKCRIIPVPAQDRVDFFCDDSVAQDGDACDTNGEEACTLDHKGMFVCRGNKFGSLRPCSGGCVYEEQSDHYACHDAPIPVDVVPPPDKRRGKR